MEKNAPTMSIWRKINVLLRNWWHADQLPRPIAVLIDGENCQASLAAFVLVEAGTFGAVTVRRIYGNWAHGSMTGWQTAIAHYALTPVQHAHPVVGKNGSDIAMAIDALDLWYSGLDQFCLVSSDADFTPLALRLRERGSLVIGIGRPETSDGYQKACTVFIPTHKLTSVVKGKAISPAQASTTEMALSGLTNGHAVVKGSTSVPMEAEVPTEDKKQAIVTLLREEYRQLALEKQNEWVSLTPLGARLKELQPGYRSRHGGAKTLTKLVQQYPTVFETRVGDGSQTEIREVQSRQM
jgi:hypothetical protein